MSESRLSGADKEAVNPIHRLAPAVRCRLFAGIVAAWSAVAGCNKPPPPAPTPVVQPQPAPPAAAGESAPVAVAESVPSSDPVRRASAPTSNLSGDTEPPGLTGRYAIVGDPGQEGSRFAIDFPEGQASVDRFAMTPAPPKVDSTRFVIAGGRVLDADVGDLGGGTPATDFELPEGFTPIAAAGYSAEGMPRRIRCDVDGSIMALVPEGIFIQGKENADPNVAPEHGVLLDPYYMDTREVTFEKYMEYREQAREAKKRVAEPAHTPRDPKAPVTGISWAEARNYALWAGKDLPTEAQWEKAARGVDGFDFPWGNGPYVWHRPRRPGQLDRVAVFRGDVSPFGIADMAGNAREWCNDWYQDKYYVQLASADGATARNPAGPRSSGTGSQRVVKGAGDRWHVWVRGGVPQGDRPADVGFRCVLRVTPPGSDSTAEAAPTSVGGSRTASRPQRSGAGARKFGGAEPQTE